MTLVFQYGSNISEQRINSEERLNGDAKYRCVAKTKNLFIFDFTVDSKSNRCAAADIKPSSAGRSIFGVVYEMPDYLVYREKGKGRKTLDEIEGQGCTYVRKKILLITQDGTEIEALTYFARNRLYNIKTSWNYVKHILKGLQEYPFPEEYRQYVRSRIIKNNKALEKEMRSWYSTKNFC